MIPTTLAAVKDILASVALIGSMVLCFAIIMAWVGLSYRGFESHPLRSMSLLYKGLPLCTTLVQPLGHGSCYRAG
jgi:hypothetical protein